MGGRLIPGLLLVLLAGCAPLDGEQGAPVATPLVATATPAPAPAPVEPCGAAAWKAGDHWLTTASRECVTPLADGGRQCTDSNQCEGMCITGPGAPGDEAESVVGICQRVDPHSGCYAEIQGGKRVDRRCVH